MKYCLKKQKYSLSLPFWYASQIMEIKNFDLKIFQKSSKAENLVNPKISSVKHFILKKQKIQDYSKLCVRQENKNDIKIVQVSSKLPPKPKKAMSVSNESIFEYSIKCEKQQPKKKCHGNQKICLAANCLASRQRQHIHTKT
ncbi:hypothetical protein BpHYR1_047135 [Brachionus plicatilis]|uniref:Uncharacterized protein n=1 Tax=Brachionus plicatilis TaxID=10195 RepID=A0A3M7RPD8_BRAPC|nr:hypothetical protein BpHYR1_047135 [Brachionus plicatilis]